MVFIMNKSAIVMKEMIQYFVGFEEGITDV